MEKSVPRKRGPVTIDPVARKELVKLGPNWARRVREAVYILESGNSRSEVRRMGLTKADGNKDTVCVRLAHRRIFFIQNRDGSLHIARVITKRGR